MNARIKQLAEQAKDFMTDQVSYLSRIHNRSLSTTEVEDIFEEKFGELIVRDCALTAGIMEYEGRAGIGAQLLDNFGVEE